MQVNRRKKRFVTLAIPNFSGLRVLVAGDAMLDEYWFGEASRISPEAPVPVVRTASSEHRPGGAANVALNAAALGASVRLVAAVGRDERGDALERALETAGVLCDFVHSPGLPTIHKLRVLARNQQLMRLDAEQPLDACGDEVAEHVGAALPSTDIVLLSDYGKGSLSRVETLIEACRAANVRVLVDPKGRDFSRYSRANVLTPNEAEFAAVAGAWQREDEFLGKAERLRAELGLDLLLVTRGPRGMALVSGNEPPVTLAA